MNIFLASGNKHKKQELSAIFAPHNVRIPSECGIDFNPVENGATFMENSLIKARALWDIVHEPVIADDSGICVDLLGGRPGIFSARYCGMGKTAQHESEKLSDFERNKLLLKETAFHLERYRKDNPCDTKDDATLRACRFVCAMVLYVGNEKFYCVQETLEGNIVASIDECKGSGGFGYDPIVFLPEYGKTVSELSEEEKNAVSHRGKAGKAMARFLENLAR